MEKTWRKVANNLAVAAVIVTVYNAYTMLIPLYHIIQQLCLEEQLMYQATALVVGRIIHLIIQLLV